LVRKKHQSREEVPPPLRGNENKGPRIQEKEFAEEKIPRKRDSSMDGKKKSYWNTVYKDQRRIAVTR